MSLSLEMAEISRKKRKTPSFDPVTLRFDLDQKIKFTDIVFSPDIKNSKDFIRAFTVGKIHHTTFVAKAVLNIKIEKRVYDVTVTLLLVVEQNEGHIRTQRPKIYKHQCQNLQK